MVIHYEKRKKKQCIKDGTLQMYKEICDNDACIIDY